jgi:Acetyl-coenzyme A synthetase N-terminus
MNIQSNSGYHEVYARSLADPEGFWAEAAREIDWIEPAKKIFDPAMGAYGRWFAGAVVNTCYNALDRHVAGGRADQVALIHDSPLTNSISKFTYAEMLKEVQTLAAVMADFGVAKGDRVILYMPLVPEAVRDAGLRADRRGAFGGVRRFCCERARNADRGRQAEIDFFGELRDRARPHRAVQAVAR